jgi:hypothetical protein
MDRGSSKHGPRLDEEMEHEVRGHLQGSGAGGRAEEWHEPEPAGEDEPDALDAPAMGRRQDAQPPIEMDGQEREERSRFGRYLPRTAFPADRAGLLAAARSSNAPDDLVRELEKLDPDQRFVTVAEVWEALGYEPDRRF